MGFRNWMTKKASTTADIIVEQTKGAIRKSVSKDIVTRGNVLATLGRIGVILLTGLLVAKEVKDTVHEEKDKTQLPTTININNYIYDSKERGNDK